MNSVTTTTDLKQLIYEKIERLSAEQLAVLLHLLENNSLLDLDNQRNGSISENGHALTEQEAKYAKWPWMEYVDQLKDSPNWDEFEEDLAEFRREANEEYELG